MKTPREILLARHAQAQPQLDDIRRRALAAASTSAPARAAFWDRLARSAAEFFRIPRLAWAGFGAAWAIIIALNIASSETSPGRPPAAAQAPSRSPEMLQALREQKRFYDELVGAVQETIDAKTPRFVPRPRSEGCPSIGLDLA